MALKARGIFEYFSSSKTFRLEQAWSALGFGYLDRCTIFGHIWGALASSRAHVDAPHHRIVRFAAKSGLLATGAAPQGSTP